MESRREMCSEEREKRSERREVREEERKERWEDCLRQRASKVWDLRD